MSRRPLLLHARRGHTDLSDFDADSRARIRDVGVPSGNGQHALVAKQPYQRCMLARGWAREQKIEPVEAGWYRRIESDDVVSLAEGVPQPSSSATGPADGTKRAFCYQRHLEMRSTGETGWPTTKSV